jgi:hypothetical protein
MRKQPWKFEGTLFIIFRREGLREDEGPLCQGVLEFRMGV